ncbi:MAG: NAD(P)-dependent oxidoreductase [Chlorobiaceae bacterium]|nr:NAD(P)-dependent oxidoreductase [Chlorobiaceae bacterium]
MNDKVILTGGSGFIGSKVYVELIKSGYDVLSIDIKKPENITQKHEICDLLDKNKLNNIINRFNPSSIIHLAARADLTENNDLNGYDVNISGVNNLISVIQENPSIKRCIFTSSQLVCHVKYKPKNDTDFAPVNLYGESKVLGEKIVRSTDGGGVTWCIVRPTTIWGPGMSDHYQRFLKMINKSQYYHIGYQPLKKYYGFVGNTAYQYCCLLKAPSQSIHRKVLYMADYEPIVLQEWANAFQRNFNAGNIKTIPVIIAKSIAMFGDILNVIGFKGFPFNSFRLRNVLSEPDFDINPMKLICNKLPFSMNDGVQETVKWYCERNKSE